MAGTGCAATSGITETWPARHPPTARRRGFNRRQEASSGTRLLVAVLVGVAVGAVAGALVDWSFLPLVAWVVAGGVFLGWTLTAVWPLDGAATHRLALREDPSRPLTDVILLVLSVAAMLAVAMVIFRVNEQDSAVETARVVLGVLSVIVSWAVLHTVFTLKYTREYYGDSPGGIDFGSQENRATATSPTSPSRSA